MLDITEKAQDMLNQYISQGEDTNLAVRIEIVGRGAKGFNYDLQLVPIKDAKDGDVETESNGLKLLIAEKSVQYINGTTLDYKETLMGGGFAFDNPNPLWIDDLSQSVADVIAEHVNPAVASHGGHVDLLGVDEGKAYIAFGGGCQGCGMVDVTLKQGVEVMITDNVPGISEIIDTTDPVSYTHLTLPTIYSV